MLKKKITKNNKFAQYYTGCSVVASLMNVHSDTVRRRVKAGKIPGQQACDGVWTFSHDELAKAGITPFKDFDYNGNSVKNKKNVTRVHYAGNII